MLSFLFFIQNCTALPCAEQEIPDFSEIGRYKKNIDIFILYCEIIHILDRKWVQIAIM